MRHQVTFVKSYSRLLNKFYYCQSFKVNYGDPHKTSEPKKKKIKITQYRIKKKHC